MKKSILTLFALSVSAVLSAQIVYRPLPKEWKYLTDGGEFKDLLMPMKGDNLAKGNWGAYGVRTRLLDNGAEDDKISLWGGNIKRGEDGIYNMYICGWQENNPIGHFGYPDSKVYHATSKNQWGPFKIVSEVGPGHNPELICLDDGSYMIYHVIKEIKKPDPAREFRYYHSKSLNGPWEPKILKYDMRDRPVSLGGGIWFHNMSFTKREDGSVLAILRNGSIWISKNGTSTYDLITTESKYPLTDGRYEDPVIWKDNVQYHAIANDWIGRWAFYMRSKDGINWVVDEGTAYDTTVAYHKDGVVEDWFKFERIRIYQDEYGRAIQANFAVIDTVKFDDLPNDIHSSKNISIPVKKGMLLTMLNNKPIDYKTREIAVKVQAEEGFNPQTDIDIKSLRLGSSTEVNYGRGAKVLKTKNDGKDLIVIFESKNHCISADEFAPKILGKDKNGEVIFGFMRLPWVNYTPEILSARKPKLENDKVVVRIDNHGLAESKETIVVLSYYDENGKLIECANTTLPSIKPYENATISLNSKQKFKGDNKALIQVKILVRDSKPVVFNTTI